MTRGLVWAGPRLRSPLPAGEERKLKTCGRMEVPGEGSPGWRAGHAQAQVVGGFRAAWMVRHGTELSLLKEQRWSGWGALPSFSFQSGHSLGTALDGASGTKVSLRSSTQGGVSRQREALVLSGQF